MPIPMTKEMKKNITGKTILTAAIAWGLTMPTNIMSMTLKPVWNSMATTIGRDMRMMFLLMLPVRRSGWLRD